MLIDKIHDFLVEAVSNVVSVSFNFLCKAELEEKEAMEYASKNMMLNVHSIFRKTMQAIESNLTLQRLTNFPELKEALTIEVDNILENVLINLADNYPQAPASGGTPRMREVISEVNRINDEENDFIYANGLRIEDYLTYEKDEKGVERLSFAEETDYTQYIMKVINRAIEVTQSSEDENNERTVR